MNTEEKSIPDDNKIFRAVIYLREACMDSDRATLRTLEENCRKFAAESGWSIAKVFIDRGYSAHDLNRPGLSDMLAYLERGWKTEETPYVLASDIAQLARDPKTFNSLKWRIESLGSTIMIPGIGNSHAPSSEFIMNVLAANSAYQDRKRQTCSKV